MEISIIGLLAELAVVVGVGGVVVLVIRQIGQRAPRQLAAVLLALAAVVTAVQQLLGALR
jgi:drug/metabolite transporter (DMT)-like permease